MARKIVRSGRYSLPVLGFSAMLAQVVMVREALAAFEGNELVTGLVLGGWMLLTASGARLSGKLKSVPALHLLLAISSILALVLMALIRSWLVQPGAMAGFYGTALVIFLSMLPFCLFSGMLFPLLSESYMDDRNKPDPGGAYALESAGSLAGGVIFSLILVYFLDNWQSITLVFLLNVLLSIYLWWNDGKKGLAAGLTVISIACLIFMFIFQPGMWIQRLQYPGQKISEIKETPYGRLVVTSLNGQQTIYTNGKPLPQVDDVVTREESVHYAMLVKHEAESVLMISGGSSGALDEVLKYRNAKVDYLETDPFLIGLVEKYYGLTTDPRISIIHKDPIRYLKHTAKAYDVILVNAPDPSSGLSNRLFTADFIHELKGHLAENGMLCISIKAGSNYLGKEDLRLHSVIYNSLKKEFKQVGLVPGQRHYFVASDLLPMKMLGEAYRDAGIENIYVNPSYINEMQLGQRSRDIMKRLEPGAGLNTDIRPVGYWLQVQQWLRQFSINKYIIPGILLLSLLIFMLLLKPLDLGLFAGGLSSSSAELILLFWMQSVFGYLYQLAGLVFALFMAGLVLGVRYFPRKIKKPDWNSFMKLQFIMAAFILMLLLFIFLSDSVRINEWINLALIFTFTMTAGVITGLQYFVAMKVRKEGLLAGTSRTYSADLAGSAIGALLVSIFCMPVMGIYLTLIMLAGFDIVVIFITHLRK